MPLQNNEDLTESLRMLDRTMLFNVVADNATF